MLAIFPQVNELEHMFREEIDFVCSEQLSCKYLE